MLKLVMRRISVKQAQAFDVFAQEKLGIPSIVLMENAGKAVADEVVRWLGFRKKSKKNVCVICGEGNNGGDGFVAARHLANAGVRVEVVLIGKPSKLKPDPRINYNILKKMGVIKGNQGVSRLIRGDLIIDALFGIGLNSEVREPYLGIIQEINDSGIRVLSVDVPSGLDADTGKVLGAAVKAKKTVTFVAEKKGFAKAKKYCGRIMVKDIGIKSLKYN